MMGSGRATRAAIVLSSVLGAGAARAAPQVSLGLSYQAAPTCPDRTVFARRVRDRVPSVDFSFVGSERADISVELRESTEGFSGHLRIRRADGRDHVRDMSEKSCEELSAALAFVAALALGGEEAEPMPNLPRAPVRTKDPPEEPALEPPPSVDIDLRLAWGIGVGVGIRHGIAPTWANTEELDIELRSTADSPFAPTFRLGVVHAEPVMRVDRAGSTDFGWTAGRVSGCPFRVRPLTEIELRPCVGMDLGVIGASGVPSTVRGRSGDTLSPWVDVFGAARLQLHLLGPLYAVGEAEVVLPLTRFTFEFDPGFPVYRVPAAAGAGLVGLLGQFP
jgi:hypothetical protein